MNYRTRCRLELLLIYLVTDASNRPDPVHRFHQQKGILVAHDRTFGQAHTQTITHMPGFKLVTKTGFPVVGDHLPAVDASRIKW